MDCSQVEDSLDSLWFFSNVLWSRTQQSDVNEDAVQEEPAKPKNPTEEKTEINESPCAESLVPRCPRCGEFAAEVQARQVLKVEEFSKPAEEKRKSSRSSRKKRRSKRSLFHERRKILGELELGFDYANLDSEWGFDEDQTRNEQQIFGNQHHMNMKMPPLNDNMAMKEHLKSWAYAVACTVK